MKVDRGDKFTNPTNSYMQREHDRIVASGKRAANCPGCKLPRWFDPETLQMPDYLCDKCIVEGVPREAPRLAPTGELTLRQRAKKGMGHG